MERRFAGASDLASQPDLAISEPLDLTLLPCQYPHTRCAGWPDQPFLDRSDSVQFILAVWLWKPATPDIDCGWLRFQPPSEFPGLHVYRANCHSFQHSERRNDRSQRYVPVSQPAPALARFLAAVSVFRLTP